jgi:hypothetical protein
MTGSYFLSAIDIAEVESERRSQQRELWLLALAEECSQPHEDGQNQMLEVVIVPERVIQRASSPGWKVCFGLIAPDIEPPVLLKYLGKMNLLKTDHTTILLAEGQ